MICNRIQLLSRNAAGYRRIGFALIGVAAFLGSFSVISAASRTERSCRPHKDEVRRFAPELTTLWERSRPNSGSAVEQGAVIVKGDQGRSVFIAYHRISDKPANTLPDGFEELLERTAERTRYIVHTHPFTAGIPFMMSNGVMITPRSQSEIDRPSGRDYSIIPDGVYGFLVTRLGIHVYDREGIRCSVRWKSLPKESRN